MIVTSRNGGFFPETALLIAEGTKAELTLPDAVTEPEFSVVEILKARFPESVGVLSDADADDMLSHVNEAFRRVDGVHRFCRNPVAPAT